MPTREELEIRLAELKKKKAVLVDIEKKKIELKRRKRDNPIFYYAVKSDYSVFGPHLKQRLFHASQRKIRILSGGNRAGKTTAGTNEDVAFALGYRPWLPQDHPDYWVKVNGKKIPVPNHGLVIGESFGEQVKKVLGPKLLGTHATQEGDQEFGQIPRSLVAHTKKNQQGVVIHIRFTNGSTIDLQSYDQEVDLFESKSWLWVHFDEPPPRPIWIAVQRGLTDRNGVCWITMTPLKEAWIFDELYVRNDVDVFYCDIRENVGYGLTEQGVAEFERSLTGDEKEARLHGKYYHLVGRVYKSYDKLHRIPRVPVKKIWNIWMHIDTHPRTPHHAVWLAVLPNNLKYLVGELKNSHPANLVEPFGYAILEYERSILHIDSNQVNRLIEPGSQVNNPLQEGHSIYDEFSDLGIVCELGSKNLDAGILKMQDALQHDKEKGVYPTLFIFDDLIGVDYELTHYVWDDWRGKHAVEKDLKQRPKDKDDHFIEGIHRILLADPVYYSQVGDYVEVGSNNHKSGANSVTGY